MHHSTTMTLILAFAVSSASETSASGLLPRQTNLATADCDAVSSSIEAMVDGFPLASNMGAINYLATQTIHDICAKVTAAPASLSSDLSSWLSQVTSHYVANPGQLASLSSVWASSCTSASGYDSVREGLGAITGYSSAAAYETAARAKATGTRGSSGSTSTAKGAAPVKTAGAVGAVLAVVVGPVAAM